MTNHSSSCQENLMVQKRKKDTILVDEPPRLECIQYATGEEQKTITNSSRKNEETEPKQKSHSNMDVSGGESKDQSSKEQYCIGTWNVRSMNQSELDVVKQEMAIVNINILGISELKWTGMEKLIPDDQYIYYSGQESLRKNGVAIKVNKKNSKMQYLGITSKMTE